MFGNILATACRNLSRHKLHGFINIAGLTVALACAIFIILFVLALLVRIALFFAIAPIMRKVAASYGFDVTFDRLPTPRTLVIAEMYRPGWTASAGDLHPSTFAFLDSLLAVRVPAGAASVHFAYRPRVMYAASLGALAAIAASLLALIRFAV